MKLVKQEGDMGCGVACVASICSINYRRARELFNIDVEHRGVYCEDIVKALAKKGKKYSWKKVRKGEKIANGSIVFIKSKKYPVGHYLVKTTAGYMDSWINVNHRFNLKVKAGYRKALPEKLTHIIYPFIE